MGLDWNPHRPARVGLEHEQAGYAHDSVSSSAKFSAVRFRARRTGEIDEVDLYAGAGAAATPLDGRYEDLNRPMIVDLFPAGSEPYTISATTYLPSAVSAIGGIVNENWTSPPNVNRITAQNDGLFLAAPAFGDGVQISFNTGAFPLNRRILKVTIGVKVNLSVGIRRVDNTGLPTASNPWFINLPHWSSGTRIIEYDWGEAKVDAGTGVWSHWTAQQIRDFRSGGSRAVRVTCQAGPGYWNLDYAYLRVYWAPENRLGIGLGSPVSSGWIPFVLRTPDASTSPSLTSGQEYTMILRRIVDYSLHGVALATLPWRYLNGYDKEGEWRRRAVSVNPFIGIQGIGGELYGIPCARFIDNNTVIDDAQPYELQRGALVYEGQDLYQSLSLPGDATLYGQAFLFVGFNEDAPRPEAPLAVEVELPDSTGVFSAVSITADEVAAMGGTVTKDDQNISYRLIRLRFPETAALSAGEYWVRVFSLGTSFARSWRVGCLIGDAHTIDQTYGGTTAAAGGYFLRADGSTDPLSGGAWTSDAQVGIAEVPPAVTGVGVAVGETGGHHTEVCDGLECPGATCPGCCEDDSIPTAVLTWSAVAASPPPATVTGYEIQRQDDAMDPDDWEDVAFVDGRLTTMWTDVEPRLEVPTRYRIRQVRSDGVTGDWSAEVSVTIPAGQVALSLSSNAATGLGLVYYEVWDGNEVERDWAFREAAEVELVPMYGRNRPVAFRPLEEDGDEFTRVLLLNAGCSVAPPTKRIFRPLRDLSRAPIPYVCVRDGEGNRWYATMMVPDGRNLRPGERWLTTVRFVEVADRAHMVDTSVPQITQAARA